MRQLKTNASAIALLSMGSLFAQAALAGGSELEFDTRVGSITPLDDEFTVITILVRGFEVPLVIDDDTELERGDEDIALDELLVGDRIHVEASFEDGALVADEIAIVSERGMFTMRGEISGVEFSGTPTATNSLAVTTITLLGVDILVDGGTRITGRGLGLGNRVPPSELAAGDEVKVAGSFDGDFLWADRIHIGERAEGAIEIEGRVGELTPDGFLILLERGGQLVVLVDEDSEVDGVIEEGAKVRVEGLLNENLAVLADEIDARSADRRGRGRFQVSRRAADDDDRPGRDLDRDDDDDSPGLGRDDDRPGLGLGRDNGNGNGNPGRGRGRAGAGD